MPLNSGPGCNVGSEPFPVKNKKLQRDLTLRHHFSQIDEPVAHASECRVDAAIGHGCDFLEAQVGVMTQNDDLSLVGGELIQHIPYPIVVLATNQLVFHGLFREIQYFKEVLILSGLDSGGSLHFPEMVNAEVVRDPHGPGQKFSFIGIASGSQGVNDLDEGILKDIFRQIAVLNQKQD